ncbi:MAG: helix-turn-helix domain-containing protein [Cytophagales bacterium]|nr:helix-turn-helix domain-containing protein [Cytophagales bacterium]
MKDLFKRLKSCRKQLGFSQAEMAQKSYFEQKDISRFENGKVKFIPIPYIVFLYRQGINLNWLYSGEGPAMIEDLAIPDHPKDPELNRQPSIPTEIQHKIEEQKEQLLTLQVENKLLKKQVKELKVERKTLLEAFKTIGR